MHANDWQWWRWWWQWRRQQQWQRQRYVCMCVVHASECIVRVTRSTTINNLQQHCNNFWISLSDGRFRCCQCVVLHSEHWANTQQLCVKCWIEFWTNPFSYALPLHTQRETLQIFWFIMASNAKIQMKPQFSSILMCEFKQIFTKNGIHRALFQRSSYCWAM